MSEITALLQDDLILLVLPLFLLGVIIESAYSAWRKLDWYQWQDTARTGRNKLKKIHPEGYSAALQRNQEPPSTICV